MKARAVLALAVFAVLLGTPASVDAASSVESGWWTSAQVAVAPDVGDDQLLVQGGIDPTQPVAYAGISFELADGEMPEKLVLTVAPNSGTTPGATVSVCALGGTATPAKGEPAASGPSFDCAGKVDGGPSADGATYAFDVAGLVGQGALDVAVVPTKPADRVVFQKPGVDALQSSAGGSSAATESAFDDGTFSDGGAGGDALQPGDLSLGSPGPVGTDLGGSASGAALDLPAMPAPQPAAPSPPRAAGADQPTERLGTPVVSQQAVGGGSRSLAPFVFGGLLAAAAALWALAGHGTPEAAVDAGDDNR